jgi:hypothetical protein
MKKSPEEEIPLTGGNINADIVRVGDSVHRAIGPQSANVHKLLQHLENIGFPASPRFLGIDERGRETLSYVEGDDASLDQIWQQIDPLIAAGKLLRAFHDATVSFEGDNTDGWAYRYPDNSRHEVICHNDFAPYNLIFNKGNPTYIIDFDVAGPGPRLRDLAYLAYWCVPLSFHAEDMVPHTQRDIINNSHRLKLICASYDIACDENLLDMVAEILRHMSSEKAMRNIVGDENTERLMRDGHLKHWRQEAMAFETNSHKIAVNL